MGTIQRQFWAMVMIGGAFLAGCAPPDDSESEQISEAAVLTENGLGSINGLSSSNGLGSVNGLSSANGLASANGLSSANGLMTTSAGRTTVSYLVRCALPANRSIVKKDQYGKSFTYQGKLGFAPEWETGACNLQCQEYMTACMMAHVNVTGAHVPIWLAAQKSGVGWGLSSTYPRQEGSFFGNIFVSPPAAWYCEGKDFAVGAVAGRIGSNQVGTAYKNMFSWNTYKCQSPNSWTNCSSADSPNTASGFKACSGYNNVVTVWRK